jgi:hypothetical protein
MTKEFYTEKELAERWCLKVVTLQTWRQKGLPPLFKKFGEAVRYSTIDIEQFERESVCNSTHKYN